MVIFLKNEGEVAQRIKEHVAKVKQKFGKAPAFMRANDTCVSVPMCCIV